VSDLLPGASVGARNGYGWHSSINLIDVVLGSAGHMNRFTKKLRTKLEEHNGSSKFSIVEIMLEFKTLAILPLGRFWNISEISRKCFSKF
jgi:hypothetical protein